MGFMISKAAQYAIRTLVHLAGRSASEACPVRDIAEATGIPQPFLAKLVGQLVQGRLVDSFKGPGGGIRLARPPHRIDVLEVVRAVDGAAVFDGCFLGLQRCGEDEPCPMHEDWKVFRERLKKNLGETTIAELATIALAGRAPE
jgi:Rrf2 family transcriptional regulator, iron-sulfur cluster assembly transcription factor